jgi:hypothetical protein
MRVIHLYDWNKPNPTHVLHHVSHLNGWTTPNPFAAPCQLPEWLNQTKRHVLHQVSHLNYWAKSQTKPTCFTMPVIWMVESNQNQPKCRTLSITWMGEPCPRSAPCQSPGWLNQTKPTCCNMSVTWTKPTLTHVLDHVCHIGWTKPNPAHVLHHVNHLNGWKSEPEFWPPLSSRPTNWDMAVKRRYKRNITNFDSSSQLNLLLLKGQCHEIFDPRFFFIKQSPLGPWFTA